MNEATWTQILAAVAIGAILAGIMIALHIFGSV
jgi:uncharacterized protein (DUF2062 family)